MRMGTTGTPRSRRTASTADTRAAPAAGGSAPPVTSCGGRGWRGRLGRELRSTPVGEEPRGNDGRDGSRDARRGSDRAAASLAIHGHAHAHELGARLAQDARGLAHRGARGDDVVHEQHAAALDGGADERVHGMEM